MLGKLIYFLKRLHFIVYQNTYHTHLSWIKIIFIKIPSKSRYWTYYLKSMDKVMQCIPWQILLKQESPSWISHSGNRQVWQGQYLQAPLSTRFLFSVLTYFFNSLIHAIWMELNLLFIIYCMVKLYGIIFWVLSLQYNLKEVFRSCEANSIYRVYRSIYRANIL